MIISTIETLETGDQLRYTRSDIGLMIRQKDTGFIFANAWDLPSVEHEYEETNIRAEDGVILPEDFLKQVACDVLLGNPVDISTYTPPEINNEEVQAND